MACAPAAQLIVNRLAEIEAEHLFRLLAGKLAIRGEPTEIEQRRVEAGVLPVHEPQALARHR